MIEQQQTPKRTRRGMGFAYQRGNVWWIQFYSNGKRFREPTAAGNETQANKVLKQRHADAKSGKPFGHDVEKTTLADLCAMLENDYTANGRRARVISAPCQHLKDFFGGDCRAIDLSSDAITKYVTERQKAGAANSTINRSLSALKRGFTLAERAAKVARKPYIAMLEEDNARQGFLTHAEFESLRDALPDDLRDPVSFLYLSGWRVGEMRSLQWRDVDLAGGVVRLRPENSKNKKGRTLPLRGELREIIERAAERRTLECLNVFHRDGEPVGLFRKSWATACKKAGLGAIIVHDLRRTAVRNLIRAGVSEKIAMGISGHRTRSVFDRYNIVTEDDLAVAIDRMNDHLSAQPKAAVSNVVSLRKVS